MALRNGAALLFSCHGKGFSPPPTGVVIKVCNSVILRKLSAYGLLALCCACSQAGPAAEVVARDGALDAPSADAGSDEPDAGDNPLDAGPDAETKHDATPGAAYDASTADADSAREALDASSDAPLDAADSSDVIADAKAPPALADLIERGVPTVTEAARPAYGALLVANQGERSYVVESRRDVEAGPFGIPWRSRFRVAAYDAGHEVWAFYAEPDDVIGDVVVHPSGDITLAVERFLPARDAYELVRLTPTGELRKRSVLSAPATIPLSDYGPDDPQPLLRRKGPFSDATAAGWLRLVADGEGLELAIMSFVDAPSSDPRSIRRAIALEALAWVADSYVERWTRVVEGMHGADPAAWAYDELRWREQAVRPFLARDALNGELWVGRAWNQSRCEANRNTFAEFGADECVRGAVNVVENERLPLAVTRFDAHGTRLGTRILRPDADAAEQLPFALAARGGELAVVGSVVRSTAAGTKRTYPDANGYVDYDGYVALYDGQGQLLRQHDFNLGRGDVLAALRWSARGIVAVGSSDWDRWQGGMSISRGARPLVVWFAPGAAEAGQRVIPLGEPSRHWNLHDLALLDDALIGYGFSDAPMTHSADGVGSSARTFGPLQVRLALPLWRAQGRR